MNVSQHFTNSRRLRVPAAVSVAVAVIYDLMVAEPAIRQPNLALEHAIALSGPVKWLYVVKVVADPSVTGVEPVQRDVGARRIVAQAGLAAVANFVLDAKSAVGFAKVRERDGQTASANRAWITFHKWLVLCHPFSFSSN